MSEDLIITALRKVVDGQEGDAQDILEKCSFFLLAQFKREVDALVLILDGAIEQAQTEDAPTDG